MPSSGSRLIARIIRETDTTFRAEIDSSSAQLHIVAIALHPSPAEATAWVEEEAKTLGVEVEWDSNRDEGAGLVGAPDQGQTCEPLRRSRRSRAVGALILTFSGDLDVLQLSGQCCEILQLAAIA